ncbi:MAG: hypothetical protein R3C58_08320 [Parvularculaceae bacterium]
MLAALKALPGCAGLDWKESFTSENPVPPDEGAPEKEIVTMGVEGLDPEAKAAGAMSNRRRGTR